MNYMCTRKLGSSLSPPLGMWGAKESNIDMLRGPFSNSVRTSRETCQGFKKWDQVAGIFNVGQSVSWGSLLLLTASEYPRVGDLVK
jgi:hypothetical protein